MQVKAIGLAARSDVTGRLCVAEKIAHGLLAGVRRAKDVVE
jgi:hypothetical protein